MEQRPGPADHHSAMYHIKLNPPFDKRVAPKMAKLVTDLLISDDDFDRCWALGNFAENIHDDDADARWTALSQCAERLLEAEHGHDRSKPWRPVVAQEGHQITRSGEPVRVRRLRRLRRRAEQLRETPDDDRLRRKVAFTAKTLASLYPGLSEVTPWNAETATEITKKLIDDETAKLRREALQKWRIDLDADIPRQRSWIKRNHQELASPGTASTSRTPTTTEHTGWRI
jgi:hypothetical protein